MGVTRRYSHHARRALSQAHLLARDYQHGVVDTDHLFAGILRQPGSVGAQVLLDLGIDARRAELEVRILHDIEDPLEVALTLTPALDRVLALASEEAHWFKHPHIGTEHLLLALARSREGGAGELMHLLNLNAEQVRRRVRTLIGDEPATASTDTNKRAARLSELSRRALNAARQLAGNGTAPGLGHLLVVLSREHRSNTSQLLQRCGLDCTGVQAALVTAAPDGPLRAGTLLEDIIACATDRAERLGMHYTGTEHILLAFAEHTTGAEVLTAHGVTVSELVAALYANLQATER